MAAFFPSKVVPKPNPTPNKSQRGKSLVGFIFLFFISLSKKSLCSISNKGIKTTAKKKKLSPGKITFSDAGARKLLVIYLAFFLAKVHQ